MKYIIEHIGSKIYKWSLLEYRHASEFVGKENFIITNVPAKSIKDVEHIATVYKESIFTLNLGLGCVLDPASEEVLVPEDSKKFDFLIIGGILGDNPPQARTTELLSRRSNLPTRNLGKKQMPTNVAVIVSKMVMDGKKLEEIEFIDNLELPVNKKLTIDLPYRYVAVDKKPLLPKYLIDFIKKRQTI